MDINRTLTVAANGDREIVMIRSFNAPRRLVVDAWTKPELLKRWLCPHNWAMDVCEIDLRVGGKYRYVWKHSGNGAEMGMSGEYKEISLPEFMVATEIFDDPWYPGEGWSRLEFFEENGWTTIKNTVTYDTVEIRDGVLASPMESGVAESYDRLEEMLPALAASA